MWALLGIPLAVAGKVLDTLFGAPEQFEFTGSTTFNGGRS